MFNNYIANKLQVNVHLSKIVDWYIDFNRG